MKIDKVITLPLRDAPEDVPLLLFPSESKDIDSEYLSSESK